MNMLAALAQRLLTLPESRLRVDGNAKLNFLRIGRDVENGIEADTTGGDMLHGVLGLRLYKDSPSLGVKRPIWTDLNEEADKQGAEGKERHRTILTFSALF